MTGASADTSGLEDWMKSWYAPAYRTACLVLNDSTGAEEAVQEAFLRMWRFRDAMPEGEAARPWLYRVVVNSCYSWARKEWGVDGRRAPQASLETLAESSPGPDEIAVVGDRAAAVRDALARLPEAFRVPVVLRYYAGMSEKEIAVAIHRRAGTVKSRLHEARRLLSADAALSAFTEEEEGTR
ncbi:MAG: sigma-70 family RNA polymerase sigma factor [Acidimicrobiales bacterium]|jgi:RNA polymerase sigma-70 factor (ECF subfamily)